MFKYNKYLLPHSFNNFFIKASQTHHRNTRRTRKHRYYIL